VERVQTLPRRTIGYEVLLVLGVSLGTSAVYSLVTILQRLSITTPLSQQAAPLNQSQANNHWFDLAYQLIGIGSALVPALLAIYLIARTNDPGTTFGFRPVRPGFDLGTGAGLALLIGVPGLGLYLAAHALGLNTTVEPSGLPDVWWRIPVLLLSAAQNAFLEEVVVVGYLMTRLRQLDWSLPAVIVTSAVLRGSYHLYQGFGGFLGNAIMGVIFALFFVRYRRVGPLAFAHFCIDAVVFVGYATLGQHLSFLH
jgi:membrane protease YdiL (CAAX protease family)